MRAPSFQKLRLPLGALAALISVGLCTSSSALAATKGECRVHSLPSFYAQGLNGNAAAVADIVEVACHEEAGQPVTIEDPELYARCGNVLKWAQPNPYTTGSGPSFNVTLDKFGNAIAVPWSHGCRAGETTITATLGVAPNTKASATFTVLPSAGGPEGFATLPASQVESGLGVATIVEATVPKSGEAKFEIKAPNLSRRCHLKPHLHWLYEGKERAGGTAVKVTLDNNGEGFAVVLGAECQVGESLVTGEEVTSPFRSFVTYFDVLPPQELI